MEKSNTQSNTQSNAQADAQATNTQTSSHDSTLLLELTSEVVAAYVVKNPIAASDLSGLI